MRSAAFRECFFRDSPRPIPQLSPMSAPDAAHLVVANDPHAIERAQGTVIEALERHAYPKAALFAVRLSLHEAISNAFRHGHKTLPPATPVTVIYSVTDQAVELAVQDQGPGFDPASVPDPTLEENLEATSGRGLMLMRAYMARVEYSDQGRRIEMTYRKPAAK